MLYKTINYTNIYKYCTNYTNDAIIIVTKCNYPNNMEIIKVFLSGYI